MRSACAISALEIVLGANIMNGNNNMEDWDGTERRKTIDSKLDVLEERVNNWMETTVEYRKALCDKMDKFYEKLDKFQCAKHEERIKNQSSAIKYLWGVVSVIVIAVVVKYLTR